jgi:HlyD family secretion protein
MRHIFSIFLLLILFACTNNDKTEYTGVLEGTVVRVPALNGGTILSLLVEEGNYVDKGQLLAITDTTDFVLQKNQVSAQIEELEVQREIAQIQLEKSEKDFAYVQEKYDRIFKLYKENSVPRQNLDDIENQLNQVSSMRTSSRQHLRSLNARRKQLQAQYELIDKKISDALVTAPLAGIVSSVYFEQGEAAPMMGALIEITSIRELETQIYIDEDMLPHVTPGEIVQASIDGIDSTLSGRISWISPKAEFTPKSILTPDTRTSLVYAVKILIRNDGDILKHGMPVVITL